MSTLLTIARRTLATRLGTGRRAASASLGDSAIAVSHLILNCPERSSEDNLREQSIEKGQRLARQEAWEELSDLIRANDEAGNQTPAGMPVANLLAFGARADIVASVQHALADVDGAEATPRLAGIDAIESVVDEFSADPRIAAIAALSHVDVAWAWQALDQRDKTEARDRAASTLHFNRAAEIIAPFERAGARSPFLTEVGCEVMVGRAPSSDKLAQQYEKLIDLNPANPGPMRAMGSYLLPRWGSDYRTLELAARRTAARYQYIWGAGGYVWVMASAMIADPAAAGVLDTDFFVDGLEDIITRHGDQHTLNWLAACCAAIETSEMMSEPTYEVLCETGCTILRDRLSELHSLTWAHAANGFNNKLPIRSTPRFASVGRELAEDFIRRHFKAEIALGMEVHLTDH